MNATNLPPSSIASVLPPSPLVWVVDDDPLVTTSVEALLSIETDYRIQTFNAPQDALAQIESDGLEPDIIVSDFLMPGMDGIQFLSAAKKKLPQATLILLTGYADKENAIAAINEAGIYKYLEKPWDNQDLLQTLQQGLERAYLVRRLEDTVSELEKAHGQLQAHNIQLTDTVAQQEVSLALTHQQLNAIVDGSEDGIITVQSDGMVVSYNPAVRSMLGHRLNDNDALPTELKDIIHPQDGQELLSLLQQHQQTGQLTNPMFESHIGEHPVEIVISPIEKIEMDGESGCQYVLIARDITRRKKIERMREDFVATLTHDLRVPLLAAIQTLSLMRDGATGQLTEQQHTLIATMIDSQQDLLNMVNTLLDIYRYESGQHPLVMDRVDMHQLAQQVLSELTPLATAKQQTITLDFSDTGVLIQGDRQEIKRVLINLVGNAIVHSGAGATITIGQHLGEHSDKTCFWVKDTGRGIPEADLKKLFDRFSQGTSQIRNSGSGLGLYLAQHIMQAHGGQIIVESEVGLGTCFTLVFNRVRASSAML